MDRVFAIGRELAAALAAAHAGGVVHHDLKPANIQLTPSGAAKYLFRRRPRDDANGHAHGDDAKRDTRLVAWLTAAAARSCIWRPSNCCNKPVDARSDIYSLGVVLFEMATGRRPFQDMDLVGLAVAMLQGPAPTADSISTCGCPERSPP